MTGLQSDVAVDIHASDGREGGHHGRHVHLGQRDLEARQLGLQGGGGVEEELPRTTISLASNSN